MKAWPSNQSSEQLHDVGDVEPLSDRIESNLELFGSLASPFKQASSEDLNERPNAGEFLQLLTNAASTRAGLIHSLYQRG